MPGGIARAVALVGALAMMPSLCGAATVFVDTIGDGSRYQMGRELARSLQVGYDSHPFSGDFTGVRPTHDPQGVGASYNPDAVVGEGTSGVPCAVLLRTDVQGEVYIQTGAFGAWVVQPFTPAQSGTVKFIDLVAQGRHSAAASQELGPEDRKLTVGLVDSTMAPLPCPPYCWTTCDVSEAHVGSVVSAVVANGWNLSAGQTYYLLIGVGQPGSWSPSGAFYANLNWAPRSVVPDAGKVGDALVNHDNANGPFIQLAGRVIGFRLRSEDQAPPVETTVGEAKSMQDGVRVTIADVALTGRTGAVGPGFFYVESVDRSAGIRVIGEADYPVGRLLSVTGTLTTINGERAIEMDTLASGGVDAPVGPLFMVNRSVGGAAASGGVGLDNVGLLVKVAGEVVSSAGADFVINDGAGGLVCRAADGITVPTTGFVKVTGVVSLDGGPPVILVRSQQDILSL